MEKYKNKTNKQSVKSRGSKIKIKKDNLQLFSMAIPGIILLILFNYIPMFGLVLAFKNFNFSKGFFGSPWVGFDNFKFFFASDTLAKLLRNTVGLNLLFLIVNTIITVIMALLLYEVTSKKAIKVYQTVIFLPFIISWTAASYALYANIASKGVINNFLNNMGKDSVSWYFTADPWPYILLICYLWKNIGYGMIIYYGNLISIDKSYFEAAQLDGATRLQIARYISIPYITPIVSMFFILSLGKVFSADFGMFYYLTKNSSVLYSVTDVIDTYVYRALRVNGDTGMSTAVGLMQSVVGFAVLIISNKISKKMNGEGAVL